MPPPDPVDATVGALKPSSLSLSATTVEYGYTVDEPTMLMISLACSVEERRTEDSRITNLFMIYFLSLFGVSIVMYWNNNTL
jgi:hypothetical protein